ncbi:MAG: carbohydrate ABC transporter permease [Candidatus Latescibacterota bacterium]|nr:MAG: carbohydrate ABC transporter permease [Candidatus Latescibacterota bacterium]
MNFIERFKKLVLYLLLTLGAAFIVLPFIWMLSTAFKPPQEVLSLKPRLIPAHPTLDNFITVFTKAPFGRFILNSTIIAVLSTISIVLTSSLGGFVFAKYRFIGRNFLFWTLISTIMIPPQVFVFPLYLFMRDLGLVDTYLGILAPSLIMGFGLFLMRQTISTIPDELLDSARIDGCSELRIYWNIIVPVIKNAMGALGIYAFITSWGYLLWPLIITNSEELFTVPLGLAVFQKRFTVEYGPMMAACTIATLPLFLAFAIFRRRIVESFVLSGLKG